MFVRGENDIEKWDAGLPDEVEIGDCSYHTFTETCLRSNILDQAVALNVRTGLWALPFSFNAS